MALIVEDGTGLTTAESYVSVATADAYFAAMGGSAGTTWSAAGTPAKEAALRRATQYIDSRYRFRGERYSWNQALEWPRLDLPEAWRWNWPVKRVQDSCCELAVRALAGDLYADVDASSVKSETVGPISTTYNDPRNGGQIRYAVVDGLLSPVSMGGGSGSIRVERA